MQKLHPPVLALPCLPLLFSLSIYQDNADSEPDPLEPYFGKYQFLLPTHPSQPQSTSNTFGLVDRPQQAPGVRLPLSRSSRRAKTPLVSDKGFPIKEVFSQHIGGASALPLQPFDSHKVVPIHLCGCFFDF